MPQKTSPKPSTSSPHSSPSSSSHDRKTNSSVVSNVTEPVCSLSSPSSEPPEIYLVYGRNVPTTSLNSQPASPLDLSESAESGSTSTSKSSSVSKSVSFNGWATPPSPSPAESSVPSPSPANLQLRTDQKKQW